MSAKVKQLHAARGQAGTEPTMARVIAAEDGEARLLEVEGEPVPVPVSEHLCHVPHLKEGDRVLVSKCDRGFVVLGRLRSPGERPRPRMEVEDGRLRVEAVGGICLQAGEARLELTPDGRIWVDGKEVYGTAAGRLRLQGATIELN